MFSLNVSHFFKVSAIAIIGILFSILLCIPHNKSLNYKDGPMPEKFAALMIKKDSLFSSLSQFDPKSHSAKCVYRLTGPVLIKIFDIDSPKGVYIMQVIAGILLYFAMAFLAYNITKNYLISLLLVSAIANTYFGRLYFLDLFLCLDILAMLSAILCLLWRNMPWVVIPATIAMFYTDERGALSAVMVYLCIKLLQNARVEMIRFSDFFTVKDKASMVLAGLLMAVVSRVVITHIYDMKLPLGEVGLDVYIRQWRHVQLGLFAGLVGIWAVISISILHAIYHRRFLYAIIILGCVCVFILVSILVHDITRSISYLMPIVFVCVKHLQHNNASALKYTLTAALVIGIFFEPIYLIKDFIMKGGYPIFIDVFFKVSSILGIGN